MRIIFTLLLSFCFLSNFAQEGHIPFLKKADLLPPSFSQASYAQITQRLDSIFAISKFVKDSEGRILDSDYIKYQRWKEYWYYRLDEGGNFPERKKEDALIDRKLKLSHRPAHQKNGDQWQAIGPFSRSGGYWGVGRVMAIAFHPTDPNTFFVGAAKGGIWKTTDGGASYVSIGDELPYNSVSNIIVDQKNPNTLIVSLGDRFGWWTESIGIYRTDDGGNTWNPTSLTFQLSDQVTVFDMKASPVSNNFIVAATAEGIYKSTDGQNFQKLTVGLPGTSYGSKYPKQVVFHPADSNTLYVSWFDYWNTTGGIFKSTDAGATWQNVTRIGVPSSTTITLAVGHASPNKLYAKFGKADDYYIRYSDDAGASWNQNPSIPELDGHILYVSPRDDDKIYSGYFYIWDSQDQGASFTKIAAWDVDWDVHVDQWVITHNPLNNRMYWGNDGGVYSYDEPSDTWTELNNGLAITQMYGISIAQDISDMVLMGSQDNGGAQLKSGVWTNTNGGDAMGNAVDPYDHNHFYTTYVNGIEIYKTTDGYQTQERIEDYPAGYKGNATWNTPISLSPQNPNHVWIATNDIYLSLDDGLSWTKKSNNLTSEPGTKIRRIEVSPVDSNAVYAYADTKLYHSTNYGDNWRFRNVRGGNISDLYLSPSDENELWISIGGYAASSKVLYSNNAGQTWQNITANLPNIPALSILYDEYADSLYLGTEIGVYSSSGTNINWKLMNNGLPLTQVTDLELQVQDRKLYASTYGRGAFELQLTTWATGLFEQAESRTCLDIYPNPNQGKIKIRDLKQETTIQLLNINGQRILQKSLLPGTHELVLDQLSPGLYFLQAASSSELFCTQKIRVEK